MAPAVVVSDSFGRAWRLGQCEVAIGCAGLRAPRRLDGPSRPPRQKRWRRRAIAVADQAAAAADLVRDKDSGVPAAIVRGLAHHVLAADGAGAAALRRRRDEDLFR